VRVTIILCRMYGEFSKDVRKTVRNYETVLRTECEGRTEVAHVRPVLIVVVQRSKSGNEVEEKDGERVAVVAGRAWIRSQSSCTGGRGEGGAMKI
jgi:hypothetical protein